MGEIIAGNGEARHLALLLVLFQVGCGGGGNSGGNSGGGSGGGGTALIWPNTSWQLLATDGEARDRFGTSVDIAGDYAIVGAPDELAANNNENGQIVDSTEAGAAYIFERQAGGNWDAGVKLVNPAGRWTGDNFGNAVAIDGDTALVAALNREGPGTTFNDIDQGAVYVFERQAYADWMHTATLNAPDATGNTRFGGSLDLSGDRAIVGTHGSTPVGAQSAPAAYIFERSGTTWDAPAKLTGHDIPAQDLFGWSVAIDGDHAAVGAPFAGGGNTFAFDQAGLVYAFHRDATGWDAGTRLFALNAAEQDDLGRSVAISGQWIVAGAPNKHLSIDDNPGAVYFFNNPSGAWLDGGHVFAPLQKRDAAFGISVDVDGGYTVVGASQECPGACSGALDMHGRSYVFELSLGTWKWVQENLSASDAAGGDAFGQSVAIDGERILVGNSQINRGGRGAGYVYDAMAVTP